MQPLRASCNHGNESVDSPAVARLPASVALVVPRSGVRQWQVDAIKRAELTDAVRVDALIETNDRSNRAPDLAMDVLALVDLAIDIDWLRRNRSRVRHRVRSRCDPRVAWPGAGSVNVESDTVSGRRQRWALVINLSDTDGERFQKMATLGVLELTLGNSRNLDDVLDRVRVGYPIIELSALLCGPQGQVELARAISAVSSRATVIRSLEELLARATSVMSRAILAAVTSDADPPAASMADRAPTRFSWSDGCGLIMRTAREYVRVATERLRADVSWFLAYRESPEQFIVNTLTCSPGGFTLLMPPRHHFYADPCVFAHEGVEHVFFEDYDRRTRKGVVSWIQRLGPGMFSVPQTVLEQPYHLSYPFVFADGDDVFMVPETARARQIQLFRATDFPRRWERAAVLLDNVRAVDATVLQHGGRWWMFASLADAHASTCDELYVYYADSPLGPWRPHTANPVKSDVRSARPAGRPFSHQGRLIRPAQNCSRVYGGSLALCEVLELTPSAYREVVIADLDPGWVPGNSRFHTLSSSKQLEFVDGTFSVVRPYASSRALSGLAGRKLGG